MIWPRNGRPKAKGSMTTVWVRKGLTYKLYIYISLLKNVLNGFYEKVVYKYD